MPKLRSIILLALHLHSISGHIVSKPSAHYSDALKIKCDALPCRSVFFDRNCFFVIDTDSDVSSTGKKCSNMLPGAQLSQSANTPADIWSALFVEKNFFISDNDVKGKTKAMCILLNQFPASSSKATLIAGKAIKQEEQKLTAQMTLPFRLPFSKGVEVGQTIIIKGTYVYTDDIHFYINLQSGTGGVRETEAKGEDMPFHMTFNFQANIVGWTAVTKGTWGPAESLPNPLKQGVPFELRIRILEGAFQVFLDQKQLYMQIARLPYTLIKHLYIAGNGHVSYVKLGESYDPVPFSTTLQQTPVANTSISRAQHKLEPAKALPYRTTRDLPYALPIKGKMQPGQSIVVKGVVTPPDQGYFWANHEIFFFLQTGNQNWRVSERTGVVDIPFHMGIRIYAGHVVFNPMVKGQWQNPVEYKPNPFKTGDIVDIRINVNDIGFQVLFNQKEFYVFKNRIPMDSSDYFMVYGNINLTQVYQEENNDPTTLQQNSVANTSISRADPKLEPMSWKLDRDHPYALPITEKMEVGRSIVVKGVVLPPKEGLNHEIFFFLQTGNQNWRVSESTGVVDIPFHMGIRMYAGLVVFNPMVKGTWQNPVEYKPNPLKTGDPVDIRINVIQYSNTICFQVLLNQKELHVFKNRIPMDTSDYFMIYGNINLTQAYVEDKYYPIPFDSSFATGFPMCYKQSCSTQRKWYTTRVLQADCKTLLISGVTVEQRRDIVSKSGNIALKFNPRFDQKNVALNSFKEKKWLVEEVVNKLPLEKNVPFEVAITNEANGFQIFVNGEHFAIYAHRMCPFDINVVETRGIFDLNVQVK